MSLSRSRRPARARPPAPYDDDSPAGGWQLSGGSPPDDRPLTPDQQAARERQEARAAEAAALRILGGAAQSQASLHRRLVQRGFSEQAAESATTAATRAGYVDDAALAGAIVSRRRGHRGTVRIVAELRARGVDIEVARTAAGAVPVEEERDAAVREARRRLRGPTLPDDRAGRRRELARIAGALARLGFPSDAVAHALRTLGAPADDAD